MIILTWWLLFIASQFPHLIISSIVYDGAKREGIPRNGMSEQGYHDPLRRAVPDKVTLDTDGFTDKSVVEVVEYTFTDYTK